MSHHGCLKLTVDGDVLVRALRIHAMCLCGARVCYRARCVSALCSMCAHHLYAVCGLQSSVFALCVQHVCAVRVLCMCCACMQDIYTCVYIYVRYVCFMNV